MKRKRLGILLLAPGCRVAENFSFGSPHLVALGSCLEREVPCRVQIIDLDYERFLPAADRVDIYNPFFDLIGISCYSSFEYLVSYYLGREIRKHRPGVCLVVGGYHPSARPGDFLLPDSPFNHVVVGEGERPLVQIAAALSRGQRLEKKLLGPDPVTDLDQLPPLNWHLMDRYLPAASRISNEVTLSLSRGCPFQCSFCMEGAKKSGRWRAFSPVRAEQELLGLHRWLNLKDKNLFICDPLFGFNRQWREEMLQRIPRLTLPVSSYWALSRADILDEKDLAAFQAAGFGLGFGLESGDPGMLDIIHKGGKAADYLQKFRQLAEQASAVNLPWGANIIAGHPGETPGTLEKSAAWISHLFDLPPALTGFLSVDPYRFYPGSPIDINLADYETRFGTHIYRKRWWNYSDIEFTSQWLNPSTALDFRNKENLTAVLFLPVLKRIAARFHYTGYAAQYFRRSTVNQIRYYLPRQRIKVIRYYYLWQDLTGRQDGDLLSDPEIKELVRQERALTVQELAKKLPEMSPRLAGVLKDVSREQFADPRYLWESTQDLTIPLLPDNSSTISAMHAYALNYTLLDLKTGDTCLEVGGGTGYGAALAARLVGPLGKVCSVEIEPGLAGQARDNLAGSANIEIISEKISLTDYIRRGFIKILYCFAIPELPDAVAQLPPGGRFLAPVLSAGGGQVLTLAQMEPGGLEITTHGQVNYVAEK